MLAWEEDRLRGFFLYISCQGIAFVDALNRIAPEFKADEFQALRDEYAELLGMPVLSLERYLAAIAAVCTLPLNRAENLDVCPPLDGDKTRLIVSMENEPHGIRNVAGNVIYISDLDPRERLLHLLESWITPEVTCHSASIMWRLYREGTRALVVCIARRDSQLRGLIRWGKHEVEFAAGKVALLEQVGGELKIHGDQVKWKKNAE